MKHIKYLFVAFVCSCLFYNNISSQTIHDFSFKQDFSIVVKDSAGDVLKHAWVGGLNACQFSEIDLNMDGIKDLFVFERIGDKVLTFINNGTANTVDYTYAPEYASRFPVGLHDWVMLKDYNCDGKEDLFMYSYGAGVAVYKNVTDTSNVLKFKLIEPTLNSLQDTWYINLYLSTVDWPAIEDLDGDGDLDILGFGNISIVVNYHRNYSMELYGTCDSLEYRLEERCWGNFSENDTSNVLKLNITCPSKKCGSSDADSIAFKQTKHTGSTLLAINLDGDNDKDLILGDVDFTGLAGLINGGTKDSAHIVSQDMSFPTGTKAVNLVSFPVPCYLDVNNDAKKDLIISTFEATLAKPETFKSVWLYNNTGTTSSPVFNYQTNEFLQGDMIEVGEGAYPVFYDYNQDGLMDLFVSNYGYRDSSYYDVAYNLKSIFSSRIALFENTGTLTNPEFKLITRDFANISQYADSISFVALYPAFGDLDGDGDDDMLTGNSKGTLYYFENTAGVGNPVNMVLTDTNYQSIDVGVFSTPQLIDLNRDSLMDLVIGEKGTSWGVPPKFKGNINYYQNTGDSVNPVFTLITDSLGGVNVTDTNLNPFFGYSVPHFFEDVNGEYRLFVGSVTGNVFYYKDIENHLDSTFTLAENMLLFIDEGIRSAVAVEDIDNDGYLDMIVGNYCGGLAYFKGDSSLLYNRITDEDITHYSVLLYPNPADETISIHLDAVQGNTPVDISIVNIIGKQVYSKTIRNTNQLDIKTNDFENGIYICRVSALSADKSSYHSVSKKFIIQH